ncbi:MAG: hypothetical protein A2058_07750 [Ignavibacteria bacterium GWA2_36_19]|nr:MAG: hypothetical protein A2058_07750 [Ignavibacteria bacterium GWA2_36_19]
MNIGIDARLLERKMTGIGRFLTLILKKLPEIDKENKYFLFSYNPIDFNNTFYTNIPTIDSFLPQKLFSPIWNNFILPLYLKKNKMDLFFSVNQIIPLVKVKNCKYVSVVHDVIYKADKNFLPFIYRIYLQIFAYFSIKSSDLIITVSNFSKLDILKNYKIDEEKVLVIHAAADQEFHPVDLGENEKEEIRKKYNLPEKIVLYIGMVENRKNILGILNIADGIYKKNKTIGFVIIGKIGHGGKILLKNIRSRKNVTYLTNINDLELKKLLNMSNVFLFPSFYEGFGFPPLEAMQSGLPVLTSNNTSMAEVVSYGGQLHDPNDINSFVDDIMRLNEDQDFYETMSKKGLERAKDFNINNTVSELVVAFNNLGNTIK